MYARGIFKCIAEYDVCQAAGMSEACVNVYWSGEENNGFDKRNSGEKKYSEI